MKLYQGIPQQPGIGQIELHFSSTTLFSKRKCQSECKIQLFFAYWFCSIPPSTLELPPPTEWNTLYMMGWWSYSGFKNPKYYTKPVQFTNKQKTQVKIEGWKEKQKFSVQTFQ
jgi:hypothetical protein